MVTGLQVKAMKQVSGSQMAAALQRIKQKVDEGDLNLRTSLPLMRRKQAEQFRATILAPFEAFETRLRIKMYQDEAQRRQEIERVASLSLSIANEVDLVSTEAQDREQLVTIESSLREVLAAHHLELLSEVRAKLHFRPLLAKVEQEEALQRAILATEHHQSSTSLTEIMTSELRLIGLVSSQAQGSPKVSILHLEPTTGDEDEPAPKELTCICASRRYIACGTDSADIHLFGRCDFEEGFYFPASALGVGKGESVTRLEISPDEAHIAFATSKKQVIVGQLAEDECIVVARHCQHASQITVLAFATLQGGLALFTGDEAGHLMVTRLGGAGEPVATAAAPVLAADAGIVQVSVHRERLLVASALRCYALALNEGPTPVPIGSQPHRRPAPYGACLLPSGHAFVSRGNNCIWKAQPKDGKVLSTLKFPDDAQPLRPPALLYPVGQADDLLLAVSDTHDVSLVNIARVAVVGSERLPPVIGLSVFEGHLYALCKRASAPGPLAVELDFSQLVTSDMVRSEELGRNKLQVSEGAERLRIEQDFESGFDVASKLLRCQAHEGVDRWRLAQLEALERLSLSETASRLRVEGEQWAAWEVDLGATADTRALLRLQKEETEGRVTVHSEWLGTCATLAAARDAQRRCLAEQGSARSAIEQDEAISWLLVEYIARQARAAMERLLPLLQAEDLWRQRLVMLEMAQRQAIVALDRQSQRPHWVVQAEVQMRARLKHEEAVAWRLMVKDLGQHRVQLDRLQMLSLDLQRQYFDGRSALMDREYDARRRLLRSFSRHVLQQSEQQINAEEFHHRSLLYRAEIDARAEQRAAWARLQAAARAYLFDRAFANVCKVEQFAREVLRREEAERAAELLQRYGAGKWGALLAAHARGRRAVQGAEEHQRQEMCRWWLNAQTVLIRLVGDRDQMQRTEEALRRIIAKEQTQAWRDLKDEAKAGRAVIRRGGKQFRVLATAEARARRDLGLQETAVWGELLNFEQRAAIATQEEGARQQLEKTADGEWAAVALLYTEWAEETFRLRLAAQEAKFRERWITRMGEEGQRRRVDMFQKVTEQFFKHFRDYVLEEPEDAGVVCNAQAAQPAVLVTADTWLVQLLGLRGKGYLDVLANKDLETDVDLLVPLTPEPSMREEEEEENGQADHDNPEPNSGSSQLHRIAKLLWFYLLLRLTDNKVRADRRHTVPGGSVEELADLSTPVRQSRRDSSQRSGFEATALLDMPLEELVLDLLMTLHDIGMDGRVNLDLLAMLCNRQKLWNAVVCIQRMVLPAHRLPNPHWAPDYQGPNGMVHAFLEHTAPQPPPTSGLAGAYLDHLLLTRSSDALSQLKHISEKMFSVWLWYLPYFFALWPKITLVCCTRIARDLSWRDVRRLCSKRCVRHARAVLQLDAAERPDDTATADVLIPYLWQLASMGIGPTDPEFVRYLLTHLIRRARWARKRTVRLLSRPLAEKWRPAHIAATALPQEAPADRARYEATLKAQKAAEAVLQQCERLIAEVVTHSESWAFEAEEVAKVFVRERYEEGLRHLDLDLFLRLKLARADTEFEDILEIIESLEDEDDAWGHLLTVAHDLTDHPCSEAPAAEAQPPPTAENSDAQSDCTIFEYDEPPEEEETAEAAVSTWDDEMMTRPLCAKDGCLLAVVFQEMEERLGLQWAQDLARGWAARRAAACPLTSAFLQRGAEAPANRPWFAP